MELKVNVARYFGDFSQTELSSAQWLSLFFSGGGAKVRKCWILLAAPPCRLFAPQLCAFVNLMSTLATSIMSDHKSGPDLDSYLPTMWL